MELSKKNKLKLNILGKQIFTEESKVEKKLLSKCFFGKRLENFLLKFSWKRNL